MPAPDTCDPSARLSLVRLTDVRALRLRGSRAHTCHELRRACLWRRQIVHDVPLAPAVGSLKMRSVHASYVETRVDELGLLRWRNASDPPAPSQYSSCVPLVWLPVWGYNIGEFFQNSVLAVAELLAAGVVDREVMLTPEVGGWPLRDYQTQMLRAFSSHPVKTMAQLAPSNCPASSSARQQSQACAQPRCFERLLLCRFRDVYDHEHPIAPWHAARRIVASLRLGYRRSAWLVNGGYKQEATRAAATSAAAPYAVLFASRANAKNGARQLTNEAELVSRCSRWVPSPRCVVGTNGDSDVVKCSPRVFGQHGFRADVAAVQEADVLVGTHGAALVHALFMRRGGALIEVRPYGFNGRCTAARLERLLYTAHKRGQRTLPTTAWCSSLATAGPDQYHFAMARQQNVTHAFVIRTLDRTLCESAHTNGVPPANVSAWDARPLNTYVRVDAFDRALAAAACTSGRGPASIPVRTLKRIPRHPDDPFEYGELHSAVVDNGP